MAHGHPPVSVDRMKGRERGREGEGERGREGGKHFCISYQTAGYFTVTFLRKNFLFKEISGINSAMFDHKINPQF